MPLRTRADPLFSWAAVDQALSPADLAAIRANARARGFQIQTSTWTLAGYPALVAQWHPTKNGELTPWDVAFSSHKRIWWKCPAGPDHEWDASPNSRSKPNGAKCPCCAGRKISVSNSLTTIAPKVAAEWHPTKNGNLTPDEVLSGSTEKRWWRCTKGPDHVWDALVNSRVLGRGCPFCAARQPSVTNSLATRAPKVAADWHPTKNGALTPGQITSASNRKVWWVCKKGHAYRATPNARTLHHTGCPVCAGFIASPTTSLAAVAPKVAQQWHPTKNGSVTPHDVPSGARKKYWWKCIVAPDHEWMASVANRVRGHSGCPACWGNLATKSNCLATTHPEIAAAWHPVRNGALTPSDVTAGSGRRVWWKCPVARDHVWQTSIGNRASGRACPFCCGRLASITNSLARLYPALAREWHPTKNARTPAEVVAGSVKKYWWRCATVPSHVWETSPARRTRDGSGCPYCAIRVRPHSKRLVFRTGKAAR